MEQEEKRQKAIERLQEIQSLLNEAISSIRYWRKELDLPCYGDVSDICEQIAIASDGDNASIEWLIGYIEDMEG